MEILNKFFELEEINGHDRCPTYLYRWTLFKCKLFKVYLHHFIADDWSLDFHDHPKRFISIGLKGSYWEDIPNPKKGYDKFIIRNCYSRYYVAPWIRTFPANHIHRLRIPYKNTWTLIIVLKTEREWGFWHKGIWIHWRKYVDSYLADQEKSC